MQVTSKEGGSSAVYCGGYIGELLGTRLEGCAVLVADIS
jgi:hypothetical protein